MAGGVEQVDVEAAVLELQDGGTDRDAALLLQLIQSEVVARWFLRAVTEPANCTAPP